jgi:hypothetical protein
MLASFEDEQDEADLRPPIRTGGAAGSIPIRFPRACQPVAPLLAYE